MPNAPEEALAETLLEEARPRQVPARSYGWTAGATILGLVISSACIVPYLHSGGGQDESVAAHLAPQELGALPAGAQMRQVRAVAPPLLSFSGHRQNYGLAGAQAAQSLKPFSAIYPKPPRISQIAAGASVLEAYKPSNEEITEKNPLRVIIAGAGVGGLALADALVKDPRMNVTVLERTDEFKRFGGPIQLASNALKVVEQMDQEVYDQVMSKFTLTGDKINGIKDGIRDEWYAKFDLSTPATDRNLPLTGVIERPELQEIYLNHLPKGVVHNGDGVESYETGDDGQSVKAIMMSGASHEADVIIGADGIWSAVRSTMRDTPPKGDGSGVTYSGYTVFAGELNYDSFDNGEVGYKVYIGPTQYFVITDIGNGRYQWYAFLARLPGSAEKEEKPDGSSAYLRNIFAAWSKDIHHILNATKEDEIAQRDLYDLPPSVRKPWTSGPVALMGDSVHAMMPNLGQGGGQALEDAFVIAQELKAATHKNEIMGKLDNYRSRRLIRSASVQGLSRLASDIIISTFDTPAKIVLDGGLKFENFQYNSIVTAMLKPVLPIFFNVQFNFLYEGWRNEAAIDLKAALGFLFIGGLILLIASGFVAENLLGLEIFGEALFGGEGLEAVLSQIRDFF